MLIIGAGISGFEAARILRQNGVRAIVLEGRNRTGGRMWSVEMKNGHVFDMGAAWIHGINGSIPGGLLSNPLWDLVQEARIETRPTETEDLRIFQTNAPVSFDVKHWYGEFVEYVREESRESATNTNMQQYADAFVQLMASVPMNGNFSSAFYICMSKMKKQQT